MTGTHHFIDLQCPYCGEWIDLALDPSAQVQDYIEDCQVCCRPMRVSVRWNEEGEAAVSASAENEG